MCLWCEAWFLLMLWYTNRVECHLSAMERAWTSIRFKTNGHRYITCNILFTFGLMEMIVKKKRPYTIIHLVVIIYLCILLISQKLYSEWFTIFKWFSMCVLVFIRFFSLLLLSCGMCVYVFEWFFFHLFTFILCFLPSSMIKCMLNTFRLSITLLLLYSSVWI